MTEPNAPKSIAALTTARNEPGFVQKWVAHYGAALGAENLFVLLDGHDQPVPEGLGRANVLRLPHRPAGRAAGDRRRARIMSHFAEGCFFSIDMVIATDVDEFLLVDPQSGQGLRAYLSGLAQPPVAISALGLDVGPASGARRPARPGAPLSGPAHVRYAHVCGALPHRSLYLIDCGDPGAGMEEPSGCRPSGWKNHLAGDLHSEAKGDGISAAPGAGRHRARSTFTCCISRAGLTPRRQARGGLRSIRAPSAFSRSSMRS
jgi:hypothetical protein